ncbi:MAG: 50S ribosomal protein L25 [Planctomycetes bacterium]|nr:50S ribosomal protein L25 [Planctomycetota bacterium]
MDIPTIQAWPREERGTRPCRRLRKRGLIPAVMYGRGEGNVLLTVQQNELEHLLKEHALILEVEWDGNSQPVQIREVQYDALGDNILHTDLGRISLSETVQVSVPVEAHGEPEGVKEGGVLELVMHEIEVECLPVNIPEEIRVEVGPLEIGDDLRIRNVAFPQGVEPVPDPNTVVVTCVPPMEMVGEEEEELAEEILAEPEVIGREEEEEEMLEEGMEEPEAPEAEEAPEEE